MLMDLGSPYTLAEIWPEAWTETWSGALWPRVTLLGLYVVSIFATAEGLARWTQVSPETRRKVVHIGAGNVILFAWWLQIPTWIGITASILFAGITLLSYFLPILTSINGVGRDSWGTFFYAVSIGVLVAGFWPIQEPQFAVLGVLMMTWGDGLAAIVGIRLGKHPYQVWGIQKSWEGSLTMGAVSFAIATAILAATLDNGGLAVAIALLVSLCGTGLETFSKFGIDNLTVPIGSAAIAFGLVTALT